MAFTPAKTREAEKNFAAQAATHAPATLIEGPLGVTLCFVFTVPKSWPKWKRAAAQAGLWKHVGKPDVDNLAKLAKDALNGVFWVDDSQAVWVTAQKRYAHEDEAPGTLVRIHTFDQATRTA